MRERRELTAWNGSTGKNGEKNKINKTLISEKCENFDTMHIANNTIFIIDIMNSESAGVLPLKWILYSVKATHFSAVDTCYDVSGMREMSMLVI